MLNLLKLSRWRRWYRYLRCRFFDHRYSVVRQLSQTSYKLHCDKCNQYFAINHDVRVILPWDWEFEELYRRLNPPKAKDGPTT